MQGIYLDNSMTTRVSEKALGQMIPFYTERWGSPSAPHQRGQNLYPTLESCYHSLYKFLGANDNNGDTVIFTSSGAEAVNQIILSAYEEITISTGKNQILTAATDEAPALMAAGRLEKMGCVASIIPVNDEGIVTLEALGDMLTPRTALLSLSWGNGLTGVIQPIEEIAALCRERGVLFHLEASHVLGKMFIDWSEVTADYISFNGDNIHAPQGTGALFVRDGAPLAPFILGGMEQAGLRAGGYNIPGLVGLATAVDEAEENRDFICMEIARLRNKLEEEIVKRVPDTVVMYQNQERLPHVTTIAFSGVANEALLYSLSRHGVYASIGGGSFQQVGLILEASGVEETLAHSAISFSLSRETTEGEIDRAIVLIVEAVLELRKISGALWQESESSFGGNQDEF